MMEQETKTENNSTKSTGNKQTDRSRRRSEKISLTIEKPEFQWVCEFAEREKISSISKAITLLIRERMKFDGKTGVEDL